MARHTGGVLDLIEGETATARIVASDETGRVHGFAMDGERAVQGALVVLAPAAPTTDWLPYAGYLTDSDGSYDLENIPAGDYRLFAVEDTGLEYTNPEVVRRYFAAAIAVRVEPHGAHEERIPVVKSAPAN